MASEREADRAESHAFQREKERERRRLRDRQRRQNMSQDQREKHLARRRRNYQLRRLRAQNAQLHASQQSQLTIETPIPHSDLVKTISSDFPQLESSMALTIQPPGGAQKRHKFAKKLRLTDIKHLVRRLNDDGAQLTGGDNIATLSCTPTKRLRLSHVKRLARLFNSNAAKG